MIKQKDDKICLHFLVLFDLVLCVYGTILRVLAVEIQHKVASLNPFAIR